MHPLHVYLCERLDEMLRDRSVVVVYDPRSELTPFFDRELPEAGTGHGDLPRVFIGERLVFLARYQGSFFGLRAAVEPIADQTQPEALVIYLPGVTRDRQGSVLMELEKGGRCYEPQLRKLALSVLRKRFTDGQIDEMLRPASVSYDDIVSLLGQDEDGSKPVSLLRTLFDGAQSEALLTRWLADEGKDAAIAGKDAVPELLKLIDARLGLRLPEETSVAEARQRTIRYVLVGEFRSDLQCEAPVAVSMVPVPASTEQVEQTPPTCQF